MHYTTAPVTVTLLECCHGTEKCVTLPPHELLIAVKIPPGIAHRQNIFIESRGNTYAIPVHTTSDDTYQRDGNDLHCEVFLSPQDRKTGTIRQMQTPWGLVRLSIPNDCPEETQFRWNGYGVPLINRGGARGDLCAVIKYVKVEKPALKSAVNKLGDILATAWALALILIIFAGLIAYVVFGLKIDFPGSQDIKDRVYQVTESLTEDDQQVSESEAAPPDLRHQELKQLMLKLTNEERVKAGVPTVKLGNNSAAQLHADAALDGCYSSHWDRWGLKPYMRYTLTGGTGANGENVSGSDYCIKWTDGYARIEDMEQEVAETVQDWMDSPGHRRTLLDPLYTELNVGLSYDSYNTMMVQHFATDYVTFDQAPHISPTGVLAMSGSVSSATFGHRQCIQRPDRLRLGSRSAYPGATIPDLQPVQRSANCIRTQTVAPRMERHWSGTRRHSRRVQLHGPIQFARRHTSPR